MYKFSVKLDIRALAQNPLTFTSSPLWEVINYKISKKSEPFQFRDIQQQVQTSNVGIWNVSKNCSLLLTSLRTNFEWKMKGTFLKELLVRLVFQDITIAVR